MPKGKGYASRAGRRIEKAGTVGAYKAASDAFRSGASKKRILRAAEQGRATAVRKAASKIMGRRSK